MTRAETTRIMAVLQAAYPAYYRSMSAGELEPVISLWSEMLADYPADVCALAVKRLIALDAKGYPPNIGQVIASVRAVLDPPEQRMTETEAWGLVKRAAANGYYHAAEEYAKLPPEIRRIIGDADTLHEWSQTESLDTVIAASFMRSYRALTEREDAARAERLRTRAASARAAERGPALTADGVAILFQANIERPEEAEDAREAGAEGIGLFRSEFLLGARTVDEFDEESQYLVYRDLAERMAPFPVTIRTFDVDESHGVHEGGRIGADPDLERGEAASRGPLGLRAIRLSLNRRDAFETQLRALSRAACHGSLRVLLPFVSGVEEVREAKSVLEGAWRAACRGIAGAPPRVPVGAMIEVPSAALTVDLLAAEADFFSIGTNDLIQYCLAVDRTDGRVARLFDPLHPAILRVIRHVARLARRRRRTVAVCGEMASDPRALLLLLGLGVTEFSMRPSAIPTARHLVRRVAMADAQRASARALGLATSGEIAAMLAEAFPGAVAGPGGENDGPLEEDEP